MPHHSFLKITYCFGIVFYYNRTAPWEKPFIKKIPEIPGL